MRSNSPTIRAGTGPGEPILLKTEGKDDAAVKAKARLLKQARGGADFAELARKNSRTTSAKNGGGLTASTAGAGAEFDQAVFAMRPGAISDLVKTGRLPHHRAGRQKTPPRTLAEVSNS
jgi:hypothetical protein